MAMTSTWGGGEKLTLVSDPEVQCAYCGRGVPFSEVRDMEIRHNTVTKDWQLLGLTCGRSREYFGKHFMRRKKGEPSEVRVWNGRRFESLPRPLFDMLKAAK